MPIERVFLGWDQPALVSASKFLIERHLTERAVDMRDVTVVLPGARAGRRLVELLTLSAEEVGKFLLTPRIITTGSLPETLYTNSLPIATPTERAFAWLRAVQKLESEALKTLSATPLDASDLAGPLAFVQRVEALYSELAGAALCFRDIAKHCAESPDTFTDNRWTSLAALEGLYRDELTKVGLSDSHIQRIRALRAGIVPHEGEIALIGCVDINRVTRAFLSATTGTVTAFIQAPENLSDRFDELGCLNVETWVAASLPISAQMLTVAEDPARQADCLAAFLATHRPLFQSQEITIGLADPELKPFILERLREFGSEGHDSAGRSFATTNVFQLLQLVRAFLSGQGMTEWGSLARHSLVAQFIQRNSKTPYAEMLSCLDEYQSQHLQESLGKHMPPTPPALAELREFLSELLSPLTGAAREFRDWSGQVAQFLDVLLSTADSTETTLVEPAILEVLRAQLEELFHSRAGEGLKVSATTALHVLLSSLEQVNIEEPPRTDSVELLGWLELQLDDAPVHIICGFNEGRVPQAITADPFLPNSLREVLGLTCNRRRYARDAYAVTVGVHSRKEILFIAGRSDARGDRLKPSRLFFARPEKELGDRVLQFYGGPPAPRVTRVSDRRTSGAVQLPPLPERQAEALQQLRVTGFRDYIACKYRFYLKHVLGLQALDDSALELDASNFGSILHEALRIFGSSRIKDATDPKLIRDFLQSEAGALCAARFGTRPYPAVLLQQQLLLDRLELFAEIQANHARDWSIESVEFEPPRTARMQQLSNGETIELRARVDRIDRNRRDSDQILLIDYKTGDSAKTPAQAHQKGWPRPTQWIDLQLPLYHHILRQSGHQGPIGLAYFNLAADADESGLSFATWSDEELTDALQNATHIAEQIRRQEFWPPTEDLRGFDEYRLICEEIAFSGEAAR